MTIRKGWVPKDLPRVCMIVEQGAQDGAWMRYSPELVEHELSSHTIWTAREDGDVIGYIAVREPNKKQPVPEIVAIGVLRCCRQAGVATRLMQAAERHARRSGANLMDLWVRNTNERAQVFYLRRGYRTVRVKRGEFSVLLMTKQLRGKTWFPPTRSRSPQKLHRRTSGS